MAKKNEARKRKPEKLQVMEWIEAILRKPLRSEPFLTRVILKVMHSALNVD